MLLQGGHEPLPQAALVGVRRDGAAQGDDGHGRDGGAVQLDGHGDLSWGEHVVDEGKPFPGRVQLLDQGAPLQGERIGPGRGAAGGEEGGDGRDAEADVAQVPDVRGVPQLGGGVAAVPAVRVDVLRHQDAVGVVVAEHPHGEAGERAELADRHEVRVRDHGNSVWGDTVEGSRPGLDVVGHEVLGMTSGLR